MFIQIDENIRITTDVFQYKIERRQQGNKGEDSSWRPHHFYPSLELALQRLYQEEVRLIDQKGADAIVQAIQDLEASVTQLSARLMEHEATNQF